MARHLEIAQSNRKSIFNAQLLKSSGVVGVLFAISPVYAFADEVDRLIETVISTGNPVPDRATLKRACDDDSFCSARFIADFLGEQTSLSPVEDDAATRGWNVGKQSFEVFHLDDGDWRVRIHNYNAKALFEAWRNLPSAPSRIVIDLRQSVGSDNIEGMRQVAAMLTGPVPRAFEVAYVRGRSVNWSLPAARQRIVADQIDVWVDRRTRGSDEMFARLLSRYAGARIFGEQTLGNGVVRARIPVMSGWVLLVPRATLSMSEQGKSKPLHPVGPINAP